jgi:hypothetical protein
MYSSAFTAEDLKKYGYDKYIINIGTSTLNSSLGTVNNHPLVYNAIAADIVNDPTSTYWFLLPLSVQNVFRHNFPSHR